MNITFKRQAKPIVTCTFLGCKNAAFEITTISNGNYKWILRVINNPTELSFALLEDYLGHISGTYYNFFWQKSNKGDVPTNVLERMRSKKMLSLFHKFEKAELEFDAEVHKNVDRVSESLPLCLAKISEIDVNKPIIQMTEARFEDTKKIISHLLTEYYNICEE